MKDIIHTERLYLSPLKSKDVNRVVHIAKHMRATKVKNPDYFLFARFDYNSVEKDKDLPAAVKKFFITMKPAAPKVVKRFKICLRNGYIIGYIGFLYNPSTEDKSDLGIFLDPDYEHKGYAFEAQKSLLAYYFVNYDDKIYLTIYPKNLPSYRLNTKCGATKIGHIEISKYGSERDILVITRQKFIKTVFQKKFTTAEKEKQFLLDYLKAHNVSFIIDKTF